MSDEGQIKSIIERVQRLQEEKRTIEDDIKEVYAEARASGYDVKVLRAVVKHLGKDLDEVAEFDAIFDLYLQSYHAADKPSRAHVARDAGARTREVDSNFEDARPDIQTSVQSEAEAGVSPEEGSAARADRVGEVIASAHADQFVAPAGEGEGGPAPADPSPAAERPKLVRKEHALRPHCLRPELCGSYGSKHCFECDRAAKASEDEETATVPAFIRKTHDHAIGEQA